MTIDDELLLELFKPDPCGNVGKEALIVKDHVVRTHAFDYKLEDSQEISFWRKSEIERITPDIIITLKRETKTIAIELENDIKWDFQDSLRQLNKYKKNFPDTRIIIPREYKRFAPLYVHEGFKVYLWSAKRKWECLRCHYINIEENRVPPKKCKGKTKEGNSCGNTNLGEFDLVGLEGTKFEEYVPDPTQG